MISSELKFEYEVAFSFLQQDEKLAYEINDLIQDRFKTFLYSQHQKELAGTDGERTFNEIFGEKSRIVVVLYREEWGTTKWTRIEETAIRNRAHEEGYDFTMFIRIDQNSKMPKWLPKNRIYYNFDRWGVKGLAPVIEARVQEIGGTSRPESIEDQKAKSKRAYLLEEKRQTYLQGRQSFDDAQTEFNRLCRLVIDKAKLLDDREMDLRFFNVKNSDKKLILKCENYNVHFSWELAYGNSIRGSQLNVMLTHCASRAFNATEKILGHIDYDFDIRITTSEKGWSSRSKNPEFVTSEKIMDAWLKSLLDRVTTAKLELQRSR